MVGRAGALIAGGAMAEAAADGRDLVIDARAVLAGMGFLMRLIAEVLKLYVKVIWAEDLAQAEERVQCVGVSAGVDQVTHLSVAAGGKADESLGVGA
jgi:hypothetical protein